uniref:Uncharacterized protein n=1 Tax=Amphiprion percula TaxID=161767 RepID=A0A3P8SG62_AMPPE
MLRAGLNVKTLWQLMEMKTKTCLKVHGRMANLQHAMAVGAVRWMNSIRPAPVLTAAPVRALIDEQISIKGCFLPPNSPITLCSRMHSEDGDLWEAFAHFNTDANGSFSLTSDRSVGGSYSGCEPMGLFWGLHPPPGSREGLRLRKKNVETPYTVHISLLEGHVAPSGGPITELASVITERWYMAPGVRRIDIRQNGVVGTLFLPPGPGPFPAMLDMWGMGGGLNEYRSALVASRGYASLSLAYFEHKDLPGPLRELNVGDKYFKSAFRLLQDHPQIVAERVGIIGLSFGVYLTLNLATLPGINPSCLICINGPMGRTHLLPGDKGEEKYWNYDEQGYIGFRNVSHPANIAPEYKIKMEKINCPLLCIIGEDDLSSASIENADLMEEELRAAGKSHLFTRLSYPGAGHLIEPPYAPNARVTMWRVKPEKMVTLFGGYDAPHAAAQEDAWRKILCFLESNLRG